MSEYAGRDWWIQLGTHGKLLDLRMVCDRAGDLALAFVEDCDVDPEDLARLPHLESLEAELSAALDVRENWRVERLKQWRRMVSEGLGLADARAVVEGMHYRSH